MNIFVDFILCILFGYLGIHKFYERKTKVGLIYLFTFGIFGIGWIIDTIIILLQLIKGSLYSDNNNMNKNKKTIIDSTSCNIGKHIISNVDKSENTTSNYTYSIEPVNDFVDDYIVFDLETTGLDAFSNEIIEIGALKYKNNKLVETFHEFIKPSFPIPQHITAINGITNEDVKNSQNIKNILPNFISFIEDYTLIAHNNSFDLKFIMQNLKNQNIPCIKNKSIDTLSLARNFFPNLENYKLETLKTFLNIDNISHRSLSDCEVTNEVYQYCKQHNNLINAK